MQKIWIHMEGCLNPLSFLQIISSYTCILYASYRIALPCNCYVHVNFLWRLYKLLVGQRSIMSTNDQLNTQTLQHKLVYSNNTTLLHLYGANLMPSLFFLDRYTIRSSLWELELQLLCVSVMLYVTLWPVGRCDLY